MADPPVAAFSAGAHQLAGLRFAFTGQTRDAYVAFGPSAVVGALVLGSGAFVNPESDAPGPADMVNSAAVLVAVLLAPWLWHRIKPTSKATWPTGGWSPLSRLRCGRSTAWC